ncbi:MAG: metal-dependent hydrolase [Chloroflexi bacterium]|nr:metal-dependent hydrolase [Chloroflexota bacterium]
MTTPSERGALIKQIKNFPAELEALLAKYPESHYDQPVQPGEWTIRQIVHHLAEAHMNGFIRMKLVLAENKPILKPYDQDVWAAQADMKLPLEPSLQILRGLHIRWAELLENVTASYWERGGIHLENGLVTLDQLLHIYAGHGQAHLDQIRKLSPNA